MARIGLAPDDLTEETKTQDAAERMLPLYQAYLALPGINGSDDETLSDFLTDLLHLVDVRHRTGECSESAPSTLERATYHWRSEREGGWDDDAD